MIFMLSTVLWVVRDHSHQFVADIFKSAFKQLSNHCDFGGGQVVWLTCKVILKTTLPWGPVRIDKNGRIM